MERFENGQNIGQNQENIEMPEKTLKGFEGQVFEDVVFKSSTDKKGKTTYKSSNPKRKIIILGDSSEIPEENQSYRALIVEDSDPDDPMGGKMFAKIVKEDLEAEEARELVLKLQKDREAKKYENILTPEDRERLADLIKKCSEYHIGEDPYYPEEEDQNKDYHGDGDDYYLDIDDDEKLLSPAKREEIIARAKTVIDLRRQLRREGSKAVSYILELAQSAKDGTFLYGYSQMLYFAASEKDSKKVMDFYSLDSIAKNKDRSAKYNINILMSRIGTAKDVDALTTFLDKVLQTKYVNNPPIRSNKEDARLVLGILAEIKEKTTDPNDLTKIDKATKYIKTRIGGRINDMAPPLGPKRLQESFEEKFFDAELREAINRFTFFWESYVPVDGEDGRGGEMVDEVMGKLQVVLKKHNAEDKMSKLVNEAYWGLLKQWCYYSEHPGFAEVMIRIRNLTGIGPDFQGAMDSKIQQVYEEYLMDYSPFKALSYVHQLYRKSGVKFKADPEIVKNKYLEVVANDRLHPDYIQSYLDAIKDVADFNLDFSSIEDKLQEVYKNIIFKASTYEGNRHRFPGVSGIRRAEILYNATGIRPKVDEAEMQKIYKIWLRKNEAVELITAGESLTGVQPDFAGMEDAVQFQYDALAASVFDKDSYLAAKDQISDLERITKITPIFDEAKVQKIYLAYILKYSSETPIKMIQDLTGIIPNFEPHKDRIKLSYLANLTEFDPYNFDRTLDKIKNLRKITGVGLDFSPEEIKDISEYAVRKLRQIGKLSRIFRLEEVLPNPGLMARVVGEILVNSIDSSDVLSFRLAKERMKELKIRFDPEDARRLVRRYISEDPKKVPSILKFLKSEPQDDEFILPLQKAIFHDPWVVAFSRLEKIQGIAANAANDPWEKELKPLVQNAFKRGLISAEQEDDADLIVSFIEEMGMNNLPKLFEVYIDCQRHKNPDELSENTIRLCLEFGIKTQRPDGTWRFKSSLELFNELGKALKNIRTDLLADKIPNGLETDLGAELFNRLKGHTEYERNHSVSSIVEKWKETAQKNPALAELPPGFKETTLKVPLLKQQKIETTADQAEQVGKLMASQEVNDNYSPLAQAWELALNMPTKAWFTGVIGRLKNESNAILELLSKSPEEMERIIAEENDPKTKQALLKKSKALQNPKGRQGIERQAELLKRAADEIVEISKGLGSSWFEDGLANALEIINKLDGKVPLGKEIRELSALHAYMIMSDNWKKFIAELFALPDNEGISPTAERIYGVQKIAKEYIEEHYLHHLQDSAHTEHTPFSPELLEKLNLVWQQQLDKQTGYLPITFLKNKLDKILKAEPDKSHREIAVSLIPVSGLLNIYSGDLGDSCHTSQHKTMASGQFPNLRTWVYTTNRGKQNEELRGSVLAIQAEKTDGVPVLVVRANNPAENFVQSLDSDALATNVLKEAIETAKRSRAERIKKDPSLPTVKLRHMVAIPMDTRGAASTNRQSVNDVYRRRFINCEKSRLKETSETNFNGYEVWNDNGHTPSVIIWEIDEDGNEKWHGDWK